MVEAHEVEAESAALRGAVVEDAGAVGVLVLSGETTLETALKVAEDARTNPNPEFYPPDVIVRDIAELGELILAAKA